MYKTKAPFANQLGFKRIYQYRYFFMQSLPRSTTMMCLSFVVAIPLGRFNLASYESIVESSLPSLRLNTWTKLRPFSDLDATIIPSASTATPPYLPLPRNNTIMTNWITAFRTKIGQDIGQKCDVYQLFLHKE